MWEISQDEDGKNMNNNQDTILQKQQQLLTEIYVNKNVQAAMGFFNAQAAALTGLTNTKKLQSYSEIKAWLEEFLPNLPQYTIEKQEFRILNPSDQTNMICGEMILCRNDKRQRHRISAVWTKEEDWKACALDISAPEMIGKEFSEMIGQTIYDSYHTLDDKYYEKSLQLEMLLKTCGGGLAVMKDNEDLQFLYVNDTLCNILGYTQQELAEQAQASFWGIKKKDREKNVQQIRRHLSLTGNYQFEYKTAHKNGQDVWFYTTGKYGQDSSGKKRIYSIFMDVTSQKEAHLQLEIEHLHNEIVLEMNGDTILEYNYEKDEVCFREYQTNGKTETQKISDFRSKLPDILNEYIFPKDHQALMEFLSQPLPDGSVEFRGNKSGKSHCWYRLTVKSITEDNKTATELVGRVHNIEHQKRLESEANLDSLTHLYNRRHMKQKLDLLLKSENNGALVMMDIDDFKKVNDNFGHDEGDKVLILLAKLLTNHFRKEDLICRIGGDEFLVFMRNVSDKNIVLGRCRDLLRAFETQTEHYMPKAKPSLSMGIAMVDEQHKTTSVLYHCADQLLYDVKKHGKSDIKVNP